MSEQMQSRFKVLEWRKLACNNNAILLEDSVLNRYHAVTSDSMQNIAKGNPWSGTFVKPPRLIHPSRVTPRFDEKTMTRVSEAHSQSTHLFVKKVDWLAGGEGMFTSLAIRITEREIRTNEFLRCNHHANVCFYHGVTVDRRGYVEGLVFTKYGCDMTTFVRMGIKFDPEDAIRQIQAGIEHLHGLGLVHVDIKPANIFVCLQAEAPRFVVGDFDSCHGIGAEIKLKWGTRGWLLDMDHADPKMDFYSLNKVRRWVRGKGDGNPAPGAYNPLAYFPTDVILRSSESEE